MAKGRDEVGDLLPSLLTAGLVQTERHQSRQNSFQGLRRREGISGEPTLSSGGSGCLAKQTSTKRQPLVHLGLWDDCLSLGSFFLLFNSPAQ